MVCTQRADAERRRSQRAAKAAALSSLEAQIAARKAQEEGKQATTQAANEQARALAARKHVEYAHAETYYHGQRDALVAQSVLHVAGAA